MGQWILVVAIVCAMIAGTAQAVHKPWMSGFKDSLGLDCCSEYNCIVVDKLEVRGNVLDKSGYKDVRVNEIRMDMPSSSVHPSMDGENHYCYRMNIFCQVPEPQISEDCAQCVFYTINISALR